MMNGGGRRRDNMDWTKGYSSNYYIKTVDSATWRDLETIRITGGSIKKEREGLRESAEVKCTEYDGTESWIRVYLDANQGGSYAHEALFTGLATSPKWDIDGRRRSAELECYSVLKPAEDILLPRGWYVSAGANGAEAVRSLLSASPAPVTIADGAPALTNSIIAEDEETNLSMADKILEAINWRLRISGDGTISIEPYDVSADVDLDPLENDVIETKISVENDWFSCPNVFRAIDEDMTGIARDDDPASPLSTINRGREIWMQEDNCDLAEDESIAEYARRMLKDAQRVSQTVSYDRRYLPDVLPGDLIMLRYPEQGVDGLYMVESQDIELGHGATTSEEVTAKGD